MEPKAKKMMLEDLLKDKKIYPRRSIKNKKELLLEVVKNNHPNEKMISDDGLYIYPRGIDFVKKVIIKNNEECKLLDIKSASKKRKNFEKLNYEWTLFWVNKTEIFSNKKYEFYFTNDAAKIYFIILLNRKSITTES